MSKKAKQKGPLEGLRVLSLENYLAGNHFTLMLGMMGAEIIKIEHGSGDAFRNIGPWINGPNGRRGAGELRLGTYKRSIMIDLHRPEGRALFLRLIGAVDVFYTNQKPSSLTKMGIDFETLKQANSRIVYTTLSGFGHDDVISSGPFGDWTAFNMIAQGLAGLQFRATAADDRPGSNGLALGDEVTSMLAAFGTLAAVLRRDSTGEPQRVDIAMHDAMVFLNMASVTQYTLARRVPRRGRSGSTAPTGTFRTADGWMNIQVGGEPVWRRFCDAIGRPELVDDPRFKSAQDRVAHLEELDALVEGWTSQRPTMDAVGALHAKLVPSGPIFDVRQVVESPQVAARQMLVTVNDPVAGPQTIVGNPIKMPGVDNSDPVPPSLLGMDTGPVLKEWLKLSDAEINELAAQSIICLDGRDRVAKGPAPEPGG